MAITSRALSFASRWFDPQTVHRVFDPLVADWQREWLDAPASRRAMIHLKGLASFCIALIASSPMLVRTRAPKQLTDQIARRVAIATGLASILMLTLTGETQRASIYGYLVLFFLLPG